MRDIWTVAWKEIKELLDWRGGWRGSVPGLRGALPFVVLFGIVYPLQQGRAWIDTFVALPYAILFPIFLVSIMIADSIAGERERHTLETLLASRLPDRAILLGKVGVVVGYSWGLTLLNLVLGAVTVNLTRIQAAPHFYHPAVALGAVGLSLLGAGLVAGLGAVVSMRVATVREAQRRLMGGLLVLMLTPVLCAQALVAMGHVDMGVILRRVDWTAAELIAAAVLLALDLLLLGVALAQFRRPRLMLG